MADKNERNEEIYRKWSEYQEKRGLPKPEYPVQAYTQRLIDMWERLLIKWNV